MCRCPRAARPWCGGDPSTGCRGSAAGSRARASRSAGSRCRRAARPARCSGCASPRAPRPARSWIATPSSVAILRRACRHSERRLAANRRACRTAPAAPRELFDQLPRRRDRPSRASAVPARRRLRPRRCRELLRGCLVAGTSRRADGCRRPGAACSSRRRSRAGACGCRSCALRPSSARSRSTRREQLVLDRLALLHADAVPPSPSRDPTRRCAADRLPARGRTGSSPASPWRPARPRS